MKAHWNHRVIKQELGGEDYYGIHEVHYEDDKPVSYAGRANTITWHDEDELDWMMEKFKLALEKPTLTLEDFE